MNYYPNTAEGRATVNVAAIVLRSMAFDYRAIANYASIHKPAAGESMPIEPDTHIQGYRSDVVKQFINIRNICKHCSQVIMYANRGWLHEVTVTRYCHSLFNEQAEPALAEGSPEHIEVIIKCLNKRSGRFIVNFG
jgi:hypothetical protein